MTAKEYDVNKLKYGYDGVVQFWKSRFALMKLGESPFYSEYSKKKTIFWNVLMSLPMLFSIVQPLFMNTIHSFDPTRFFDLVMNLLEVNAIYNGFQWFVYTWISQGDRRTRIRYKSLFLGMLLLVLVLGKIDGQI